jgi:hypothetical protein
MLLVCIFIILLLVSVLYLQHHYKNESIYISQLKKQIENQEKLNKNETQTEVNPYYNDYNYYNDYYWFNPYKYWYNRHDYNDRHHSNQPYYKHKTVIINKQPTQVPAPTQAPAPAPAPTQAPALAPAPAPIVTVSLTPPEPQEMSPLPTLSSPENIMPENIIMPTLSL